MSGNQNSSDPVHETVRLMEELQRREGVIIPPSAKTALERFAAELPTEALRKALDSLGGTGDPTRAAASAALPEAVGLVLPGAAGLRQAVLPARIAAFAPPQATAPAGGGGPDAGPAGKTNHELLAPQDLGRLVRQARERMSLTQQAFADLAGVGRRFLSELENGKETLELGKVMRVARAAGLSLFARER